ncbi:LppA family lipoprotein [Georgenia sp. Z1491]|uniref:LppA family lipoprotein n=1 Tax=Georgenia sp. Z1491 TaxID=3416707 RepID=UPI003CF30EF0
MDDPDAQPTDSEIVELAGAVKDDLDAALGGLTWVQNRPSPSTARTGPGPDAVVERHHTFGVARSLDDDEWDRAIAIVAAHARRVGYTAAELAVDRVGDHEARFYAEDGRTLTFGTAASTILRVSVRPGAGVPSRPQGPARGGGTAGDGPAAGGPTGDGPAAAGPTGDGPTAAGRTGDGPVAGAPADQGAPVVGPADGQLPEAAPDIVDEVPRW